MELDELIKNGVFRKTDVEALYPKYYEAGEQYFKRIRSTEYSAIVFDYDKTIHNKHKETLVEEKIRLFLNKMLSEGVTICIATGNGEYIAGNIRDYFEQQYHNRVIVGYYNGGVICPLDEEVEILCDDSSIPVDFLKVKEYLEKEIPKGFIHEEGIWCEKNPYELNFYPLDEKEGNYYFEQLKAFIRDSTDLKIVQSPHSIDVIPPWISKSNVCRYLESQGLQKNEILSIGDCGDIDESDYELLCRDYSLSVNTVSEAFDSCWNFAPKELRELDATWFYLQYMKISGKNFTIFK